MPYKDFDFDNATRDRPITQDGGSTDGDRLVPAILFLMTGTVKQPQP